ncbi:MAG: DUF4428 domain-containing protein [Eubacteriaceae bacterium]|nr:DUF4428 domain-containing protein [Eubacteriaceae bacterium]
MGIFDKKTCDICGESIGLLGNKKLEDGNMCKECAKKLSPWFDERRHSTVNQIKDQLNYREQNRQFLSSFRPNRVYGHSPRVHIDDAAGTFIVTYATDWFDANPDIIKFDDVLNCEVDIRENRKELYRNTSDGKRERYDPPRYEYSYSFYIRLTVNNPYFDDITFKLSDEEPESPYTDLYRQYEQEAFELKNTLTGGRGMGGYNAPQGNYGNYSAPNVYASGSNMQNNTYANQGGYVNQNSDFASANTWKCTCGTVNTGNFCNNCGQRKPEDSSWICPKCANRNTGNFCNNCGQRR